MPEPSIQVSCPSLLWLYQPSLSCCDHCSIFGSRIAKPLVSISPCLAHVFSCFDTSPSCSFVQLNPDFFRYVSRLENGIQYACAVSLLLLSGLSVVHITYSFFSIVFSKCFCLFVLTFYIDRWTRMNIVQNIWLIIAVIHTSLMLWLFFWTSTKQQQCPHAALNACDSHQDLLFRLSMPSSSPSFFCRWKSFRVCKVPFEVSKKSSLNYAKIILIIPNFKPVLGWNATSS